ncbi:MAG TPA: ABC transporter permease [Fimbriimonadaceae bacterium]|nr:ABC transporter permease [Fimbriimonadaceae bacterium]
MNVILNIATTTVGEAIRRRVLLVILLIGVLLLSIIPALGILSARSETAVTVGTMYAVLRGTSALIAIVLTIYMLPNEIERRTIYTILSKPVQRWQFLLGKYLGAVLALLLMIALMTVFMVALFWVFQKPPAEKVAEVATQPFMYWMEMSLLSAVGMFFSTFIAPLVNFFLTIGMWLVGTVLNPLYDTLAKNGQNGVMKGIAQIVTNVLPNFANYDTKNPIINPGQVIQNGALYKWSTVGYTAMYVGILLLLAIVVFDRREV